MKHFLIKYRFKDGSPEAWREEIQTFHRRRRSRPGLEWPDRLSLHESGKWVGRGLPPRRRRRTRNGPRPLQQRDFFKHYTEETKRVSGGTVEVLPLTILAETSARP